MSESVVKKVKVKDIIVPEVRNTSVFEPEIFEEFKESVSLSGIKVPLILMKVEDKLYLVDGLHRLNAAKELGIEEVPAIIREGSFDDVLIENLVTARLHGKENPAQTAKVIKELRDRFHYSWTDIAKRLGMTAGTAKIYYDITKLPEQVLNMIADGKLSVYKARLLLEIPDPRDQVRAAEDIVRYNYSEAAVRELVKYYLQAYVEVPSAVTSMTPVHGGGEKIRCDVCGKEFEESPTYFWIHTECLEFLLKSLQELEALKSTKNQ
ncbi:MAG: ParB/RepB/Spo0J family partition protein [Candidatus Bathyarchaeia archaeon]